MESFEVLKNDYPLSIVTPRNKQYAESLILHYKQYGEYRLSIVNDSGDFLAKNTSSDSPL